MDGANILCKGFVTKTTSLLVVVMTKSLLGIIFGDKCDHSILIETFS